MSTTHPTADWTYFGGSYCDESRVELPVKDGAMSISYRRMTLQTFLNELLDAGFALERVAEPRPTEEARRIDERRYLESRQAPSFLAVRMRKI